VSYSCHVGKPEIEAEMRQVSGGKGRWRVRDMTEWKYLKELWNDGARPKQVVEFHDR